MEYGNPEAGGEAPAPAQNSPVDLEAMPCRGLVLLAINALGLAYNKCAEEYAGTEAAQRVPALLEEASGALAQANEELTRMDEQANTTPAESGPTPPAAPAPSE